MKADNELLRQYATARSEEAFAELVKRHVNLVYSAALRQVAGDAHLAHDIASSVFTDLARKAASLCGRDSLTGWLYTSTHFAAAKIARTESRRRKREEQFMRELVPNPSPDADWEQLRPILDTAMHGLNESDREAVLLRYFENQPYAEVGAKLGVNENTARMRVERALEKLRGLLAKRGISTSVALAGVISANAVQTAPGTLATTLVTASLNGASTGSLAFFNTANAMKLKVCAGALAVAGAAVILMANRSLHARAQIQNEPAQQIAQANPANQDSSNVAPKPNDAPSPANNSPVQPVKPAADIIPLDAGKNLSALPPSQTSDLDTNKAVINLKIRFFYLPQENLQALRPAWPSPASGSGILTADQFEFVRNALRSAGNSFMSAGEITTFSGREALMTMTPPSADGTNNSAITVFDVTPYFLQDSSIFRLSLRVRLSQRTDSSSQSDTQSIDKTNEAVLLPSQTAVLQKEIPAGLLPSTNSNDSPEVLLVFVTPAVIGTNQDSQPAQSAVPNDAAIEAAKMRLSNAKQGVVALLMFAADNQDQIPPTFADASRYLKDDWAQRIATNFDLVYSGAVSNIANPAQIILLEEKQPQELNGTWNKTYGFADGHAEIHRETNGDFETFEKEHTVPPPSEQ